MEGMVGKENWGWRDVLGCGKMADAGFEEIVFDGPLHEVVADG